MPARSKYVKLPADKKYHITAYEGTYSPRLHHMVSQQARQALLGTSCIPAPWAAAAATPHIHVGPMCCDARRCCSGALPAAPRCPPRPPSWLGSPSTAQSRAPPALNVRSSGHGAMAATPLCSAGAVLVQCWCSAGAVLVQCWCSAGAVLVQAGAGQAACCPDARPLADWHQHGWWTCSSAQQILCACCPLGGMDSITVAHAQYDACL
jgi:hypothetical protein